MIQPNLRALTPEQLDAYHRDGYHIARGLFSAGEAQRLIDLFMGVSPTARSRGSAMCTASPTTPTRCGSTAD